MVRLLDQTILSLRRRGLKKTLIKIMRYMRGVREENFLLSENTEHLFTESYYRNTWGDHESASGQGSSVAYTENLRKKLPELLKKFAVRSIFDAPCGDFNWMRQVLDENDFEYIGGDIVLPLIEVLSSKYANAKTKFLHIDLTKERPPYSDLMLCRDCLIHLSYHDTRLVFQNYIDSKIPYLLTSTQTRSTYKFENHDIRTGGFRPIDLFSAPYLLPKDVLFRIEDGPEMEMCLWTREQIMSAMKTFWDGSGANDLRL
jgi:hypothetical protein